MNNAEAISSFRYRLREASRQALLLGDALLQLSQDASEPVREQLSELGNVEVSLDVCNRLRLPTIKAKP